MQTAVPISPYIAITYYRSDLFKQAGVAVPKTWDQLYQTGKKMTADLNGDGKADQWAFAFGNAKGTCISQFWELQYLSSGGTFWADAKKGDFKPVVRNVELDNVTSTASPRVLFIRGFEGAVIDDIRIRNSTFKGVTATEVVTHTGAVSLQNTTIEPAKPTRGLNSVPAPIAPSTPAPSTNQ